jgi:hypothetical protein
MSEVKQENAETSEVKVKFAPLPRWCQISGIGKTTTYYWLAAGRLKAKKAGKRLLIDVEHGLKAIKELPDADIRVRPPIRRKPAP